MANPSIPLFVAAPSHDRLARDPALAEAVRRLIAAYHPLRIHLFGSRARGDENRESDYDLLLVMPKDAPPEKLCGALVYDALWGASFAKDVLVCTSEYFGQRRHIPGSLPGTVTREGVDLYAV